MKTRALLSLGPILALPLIVGCPDDVDSPDAAADASVVEDSGVEVRDAGQTAPDAEVDAGEADSGVEVRDAGFVDSGVEPDAGFVEDDFRIPGLGAPVEVRYDDYGILHLRCESDADCFAAEGYFHAAERFGQMDFRRRAARGRLSEIYGSATLPTDIYLRSVIATQDGGRLEEQLWAGTDAESQAMIQAYTRGVNAWIADLRAGRNGARLTQENDLRGPESIEDWDVLDSAACALVLVLQLTERSAIEANAGAIFGSLPPGLANDLFGLAPGSTSTVLPPSIAFGPEVDRIADLQAVQARLQGASDALRRYPKQPDLGLAKKTFGSNNWVVSASQAAGTSALLANDPHLGLSNPSVWYLVSIDSKSAGTGGTVHVAGSSLAGLPGILIGQNEDLAWGMTTTYFDMSDIYLETLNQARDAVLYNDGEVPLVDRDFTFEVAGAADHTETVRYVPHHGVLFEPDDPNDPEAMFFSLRWTGQNADTDLNFILRLMRATTLADARDNALTEVTTIGQNFVVADKAGEIGWFPYNRLPNRPWASSLMPPWLPLPGDGSAEWQGSIPYADLPQSTNPPEGYIATANNDMTGALQDGDPTGDTPNGAFQSYVAVGYRHERIMQMLLDAAPNHTPATMSEIQADVRSLLGENSVPQILSEFGGEGQTPSASGQKVVDALTAWDYTCPTGLQTRDPASAKVADAAEAAASIGCAAFHVVWTELLAGTFDDEIADAGGTGSARPDALVKILARPFALIGGEGYWDDVSTTGAEETRGDTVLAAVERAATWLEATLGADPDDWRWGRIHTVTLATDVLTDAGITRFNNGPWANDGGWYTVDVANPSGAADGSYAHASGPSMRFVCELLTTGPDCTMQLPGGQRNRPNEPHYEDLFLLWLDNQNIDLPFTPAEVDAVTAETITVRAP